MHKGRDDTARMGSQWAPWHVAGSHCPSRGAQLLSLRNVMSLQPREPGSPCGVRPDTSS